MPSKTPDNAKAGEMTYTITRQPNARIERDRAIREGSNTVTLPESESQTVMTIVTAAPKKGGS